MRSDILRSDIVRSKFAHHLPGYYTNRVNVSYRMKAVSTQTDPRLPVLCCASTCNTCAHMLIQMHMYRSRCKPSFAIRADYHSRLDCEALLCHMHIYSVRLACSRAPSSIHFP